MRIFFYVVVLLVIATSCQDELIPIPKPRIYPKVNYPARNYVPFDKNVCSFTFEYPDYMIYEQDTTFINQKAKNSCWFNMEMPVLNGSIHFTYTDISGDSSAIKLFDVITDSYQLTEKHNLKASGRKTEPFEQAEKQLYGIKYSVEGDVASPVHFVLTDSLQHAVWGALYFNTQPNADSLRPVVQFVKEDIDKLIQTFEWNKPN